MPATKSPECLLVMKLHVSRDERDIEDAAGLFVRLDYTTAQDCIDVLTATNPVGQLLFRPATLSLASVMGPPCCHEDGTTWKCYRAWRTSFLGSTVTRPRCR